METPPPPHHDEQESNGHREDGERPRDAVQHVTQVELPVVNDGRIFANRSQVAIRNCWNEVRVTGGGVLGEGRSPNEEIWFGVGVEPASERGSRFSEFPSELLHRFVVLFFRTATWRVEGALENGGQSMLLITLLIELINNSVNNSLLITRHAIR